MKFTRVAAVMLFFLLHMTSGHAAALSIPTLFPVLAERQSISGSTPMGIDPSQLSLSFDAAVSVTFVSEGAGYRNSFGWYDGASDPTVAANQNMVWNNASGTGRGLAGGGNLNAGDTVSIGQFSGGDQLGFFLNANGFSNPNTPTYFTNDAINPDGISHVVAAVVPDQGIIRIGWEDLWGGGDRDYNDLIIDVYVGVENARAIVYGAPEPSEWALLFIGSWLVYSYIRRRQQEGKLLGTSGATVPA